MGSGASSFTDEPYTGGEPTCPLNNLGLRVTDIESGTITLGGGLTILLSYNFNESLVSWQASKPGIVNLVLRQGAMQRRYVFDGQTVQGADLQAPSGLPITHIDICFNPELVLMSNVTIQSTAAVRYDRVYHWNMMLQADSNVEIAQGATGAIDFYLNVDFDQISIENAVVFGTITITNTNNFVGQDVRIDDVEEFLVDQVNFPIYLDPGQSVSFDYERSFDPNVTPTGTQVSSAVITRAQTSITIESEAAWNVQNANVTAINECIQIRSSNKGLLHSMCYSSNGNFYQLFYNVTVGPYYECGLAVSSRTETVRLVDNNIAFMAVSATVPIDVNCDAPPEPPGDQCVYKANYWRDTDADEGWNQLPAGRATPFYLTRHSYHRVMTHRKGNAYYKLAKQYVAVLLNGLVGVDMKMIEAPMGIAEDLFQRFTPDQVDRMPKRAPIRQQFTELALMLKQFIATSAQCL